MEKLKDFEAKLSKNNTRHQNQEVHKAPANIVSGMTMPHQSEETEHSHVDIISGVTMPHGQ